MKKQPSLLIFSASRRDQRFTGDTSTYLVTNKTIIFAVVVIVIVVVDENIMLMMLLSYISGRTLRSEFCLNTDVITAVVIKKSQLRYLDFSCPKPCCILCFYHIDIYAFIHIEFYAFNT